MKNILTDLFTVCSQKLDYLKEINFTFDVPKNETHGDLSSNISLILAKKLKRNPKEIAQEIINNLELNSSSISKVEIAGAGFINFFFSQNFISAIVSKIIERKDEFGKSKKYKGKKANVEFVSANPTGPLTVGHGRNAVCGDTIANMLNWIGYEVTREYYFNNAGRQMRMLGDSVKQRYLQQCGQDLIFPDDYYQGEYINEIANKIFSEFNDKLIDTEPEAIFKEKAEKEIFNNIVQTLNKMNINFDLFYNENTLYEDGRIKSLLEKFKEKNLSYEKDGAIWLKLAELGNEQDKVIVKSTGEPTYRLPDIAYHITKFERDYDLMIDVFGSDHIDTYPDVLSGLKSLEFDISKVKVLIYQFVTLVQGNEVVKMSTRKANYITLDELIDEVGADVVRYFFNMRNISSHMNFDLSLAKKHSDENPVFYLQYAHARICSILKIVEEENLKPSTENLFLLTSFEEQVLLKTLWQFEDEVLISAENYEPNRLCSYLEDLASAFHKFYTYCRIIGSEKKLAESRIALAIASKIVLKNGLQILGVSAPERM